MHYLMERLANPVLPMLGQFEIGNDKRAIAGLVREQIQRIVSARAVLGSNNALSLLDFGLAHVIDHDSQDQQALQRYAQKMQRLIECYEPRLLQPKISLRRTGEKTVPFQLVVSGRLKVDAEIESFFFELPGT